MYEILEKNLPIPSTRTVRNKFIELNDKLFCVILYIFFRTGTKNHIA